MRRDEHWDYALGLRTPVWRPRWNGFLALHRDDDGRVDGYVRYSATMNWEHNQPRSELTVDDLHALTGDAYAALWRYLAEVDLVSRVAAVRRSPSERLPWLLTNQRAAIVSDIFDGMWLRLFDVPRALAARHYETSGAIVIEVVDPQTQAPTRVVLDATPDGADCRSTDRDPDLTLPIAALSAAYLGGARLGRVVVGTGVDEHRPGAVAALDALLRTADEPWCSTGF